MIGRMSELTGVSEFMVQDFLDDPDLRLRNYALLARTFALQAAAAPPRGRPAEHCGDIASLSRLLRQIRHDLAIIQVPLQSGSIGPVSTVRCLQSCLQGLKV